MASRELSERGLDVLRVIVSDYIANREPVGSKSIVERHRFGVSAATIRNDMAMLEEANLIQAPHTSSGRIPTDLGYRLYVDRLAEVKPLSAAERRAIEQFLALGAGDFDDTLDRAVRTLASLTRSVAILQVPSLETARIRHVEFVRLAARMVLTVVITDSGRVEQRIGETTRDISVDDVAALRDRFAERLIGQTVGEAVTALRDVSAFVDEQSAVVIAPIVANLLDQILAHAPDRLLIAGAANLARTELDFPSSITPVLEAIEEQVTVLRLLGEIAEEGKELAVRIGTEHDDSALAETTVLATNYSSDGGEASIGVIGPTRMNYSQNIAAVRAVARYLSRSFDEAGA